MGRQRRFKNGSERLIKTIQLFSVSNQPAKGSLGVACTIGFHQRLNAGGFAVWFSVFRHLIVNIKIIANFNLFGFNLSCVALPRKVVTGEFAIQ